MQIHLLTTGFSGLLRLFLSLSLILIVVRCPAQADGLGSWNILNGRYAWNNKWSVFGEAQIRSLHFYNQFHYYEYKAGITYKWLPSLHLSLAAGDYDTYREGGNFITPKNNDEFRIWPQVQFLHPAGKLKIEHRYRMELRFTSNGYRSRYRYRLGATLPIISRKSNKSIIQTSVSNEIFFGGKEPYFERNRLAAGLTFRITDKINWLIGYLHQFDYRINDETGRDFLQTGIYIDLSPGKKKK